MSVEANETPNETILILAALSYFATCRGTPWVRVSDLSGALRRSRKAINGTTFLARFRHELAPQGWVEMSKDMASDWSYCHRYRLTTEGKRFLAHAGRHLQEDHDLSDEMLKYVRQLRTNGGRPSEQPTTASPDLIQQVSSTIVSNGEDAIALRSALIQRARMASSAYVYAVQSQSTNLVKIGMSTNPARRIAELRRMKGDQLFVLSVCRGGRSLEVALHRYLQSYRQHGEWFAPHDVVLRVCEMLALPEVSGLMDSEITPDVLNDSIAVSVDVSSKAAQQEEPCGPTDGGPECGWRCGAPDPVDTPVWSEIVTELDKLSNEDATGWLALLSRIVSRMSFGESWSRATRNADVPLHYLTPWAEEAIPHTYSCIRKSGAWLSTVQHKAQVRLNPRIAEEAYNARSVLQQVLYVIYMRLGVKVMACN